MVICFHKIAPIAFCLSLLTDLLRNDWDTAWLKFSIFDVSARMFVKIFRVSNKAKKMRGLLMSFDTCWWWGFSFRVRCASSSSTSPSSPEESAGPSRRCSHRSSYCYKTCGLTIWSLAALCSSRDALASMATPLTALSSDAPFGSLDHLRALPLASAVCRSSSHLPSKSCFFSWSSCQRYSTLLANYAY